MGIAYTTMIIQTVEWQIINEQVSQIFRLIVKSWLDTTFRERLIAKPKIVLESEGIKIPKDMEIQVDPLTSQWCIEIALPENQNSVVCTIPLPKKPDGIEEKEIKNWFYNHSLSIKIASLVQ